MALFFLVSFVSQSAWAADEPSRTWGDRTLAGNTFLLPATFPSAFVVSTAGIEAYGRLLNVPDVPGPTRSHSLAILGATNVYDFGLKLDEKFGIFLGGFGTGLAGSNIPALVYEPASFLFGGTLGGIYRLARWESGGQLSLRAGGGYSYGKVIGFEPLFGVTGVADASLQSVLDGAQGEGLRTPVKILAFDLTLAVAQALGQHFSLQGAASFHPAFAKVEPFNFATGQRDSHTTTVWGPSLGFAFAANGGSGTPVAAMLEYALTRRTAAEDLIATDDATTVHSMTLGVYYTGARELQLGLFGTLGLHLPQVSTRRGTSDHANTELFGIILRYIAAGMP
jgi:hypothetical protein